MPIPTTLHSTYPQLSTPHLHNHQIYRIPPTFQSPPTPKPIRHPTQTPHRQPRPIANLTSTYPERQHHLLSPTPRRAPSRNPLTTSQLRKSPLHGHPRLAVPVQRLISQSAELPTNSAKALCTAMPQGRTGNWERHEWPTFEGGDRQIRSNKNPKKDFGSSSNKNSTANRLPRQDEGGKAKGRSRASITANSRSDRPLSRRSVF